MVEATPLREVNVLAARLTAASHENQPSVLDHVG